MNRGVAMENRAMLAKIHIAKQQLAMDDATYRAMLQRIAGVNSAKALSPAAAQQVLNHLKRCGWQPKPRQAKPAVGEARQKLINKIEAQLAEAKRPWAYVDAMAERMFNVKRVAWCDVPQLVKLVAALTYDAKRHGRA